MENKYSLSIPSLKLSFILLAIALILVSLSFGLQIFRYRLGIDVTYFLPLLDVSLEQNLPTFFSFLLMVFISLILTIISFLNYKERKQYTSKWIILALGFVYMAYDEGFHVHEDLVGVIRPLLWEGRLGIFYYAWVIPGIILVILLFFFFLRFLLYLSLRNRLLFILAAMIYLTGCIGMELLGGFYDEIHGQNSLRYNAISTVEELLEMTGLIVFIYALFGYLKTQYQELSFIAR